MLFGYFIWGNKSVFKQLSYLQCVEPLQSEFVLQSPSPWLQGCSGVHLRSQQSSFYSKINFTLKERLTYRSEYPLVPPFDKVL